MLVTSGSISYHNFMEKFCLKKCWVLNNTALDNGQLLSEAQNI